jgi:hypothetical protein
LCSAIIASVRLPTEPQNSSSASCFDARPSASKVSSSSCVPAKLRHNALFNGCQSSLHNPLDGLIGTPTNDGVKPSLLFRREMNRHGVLPVFVVFRVRGKRAFRQVEQRISIEKRAYIGLARSPKSYSRHRSFGRPLIGHFGCWARSSSMASIQRCSVRSSRAGFPSCRRNFFSYCNPTRYFRNSCSIVPIGRKSRLSILGRSMKPYFL